MKGKRTKQTCLGRKHQRPREPAGNDGGGGSRLTAARLQVPPPPSPTGQLQGMCTAPRGAGGGSCGGEDQETSHPQKFDCRERAEGRREPEKVPGQGGSACVFSRYLWM